MRNFIHSKKSPEEDVTETTAPAMQSDDETSSSRDLETENLKNAIAQVMAEETAVLPHIEQLSSSITKESGMEDGETAEDGTEADKAPAPAKNDDATTVPDDSDASKAPVADTSQAKVSSWFVTFMAMRIPVAGWIYLLYLAFSKKTVNRRNFARAYLLVKLIFLVLGLIILLIVVSTAMNLLQDLLDYMAML